MAGLLDQGTHEGNQGCWHLHTSVVVEQGPMWLFGSPNGNLAFYTKLTGGYICELMETTGLNLDYMLASPV
jgi:hypothetical protein